MRSAVFLSVCLSVLPALSAQTIVPTHTSATLAKVRAAQSLNCGVDFEEAEYSMADAHGNHSLFDLDICKAIAVAVLGPGAKFTAVPYRAETDALKGLGTGQIDVLATGSLNYLNTAPGIFGFSAPVFYDYQGLMVNKALGIHSVQDLANKKTCFLVGTEIEYGLDAFMKRQAIKWLPFPFSEEGEMEAALVTRNCAAVSADVSQLAYERIAFRGVARDFEILPEVIAKDPLAITYRTDDMQWGAIMNWVVNGLVQAEESGVTQTNVAAMQGSDDPAIQRLLGSHRGYGQYLGLEDAWAAHMIGAVGNYGEIFERDLGAGSVMRLERGKNNLATHGGLMVATPMR